MKNIILLLIFFAHILIANEGYYYKNNQKVTLTPVAGPMLRANGAVDYYQNRKGILLGVTDTLIVKVKNSDNLQSYLNEFNVSIEKTLGVDLYLLKVEDKNLTIEVSNRLNEKEDVLFAHPDFIKKRMKR